MSHVEEFTESAALLTSSGESTCIPDSNSIGVSPISYDPSRHSFVPFLAVGMICSPAMSQIAMHIAVLRPSFAIMIVRIFQCKISFFTTP